MTRETIFVAPLSLVQSTVADASVSHLVTLINGETLIDTPPSIGPDRHLRLAMNDICEPQEGLVLPCETHVSHLVKFALDWDRRAPLLIHCWAGISRYRGIRTCPRASPRLSDRLSEPPSRRARR